MELHVSGQKILVSVFLGKRCPTYIVLEYKYSASVAIIQELLLEFDKLLAAVMLRSILA